MINVMFHSLGSCLFRVLESFGLEPVYNFKGWKPGPVKEGDRGEYFGNWELQLRQYMTFFRELLK